MYFIFLCYLISVLKKLIKQFKYTVGIKNKNVCINIEVIN